MVKLRVLSGQDVCKILEENEFLNIRQKGSHIVMQKLINNSSITVIVPNHKELKTGTLQSIIRQYQLNSYSVIPESNIMQENKTGKK